MKYFIISIFCGLFFSLSAFKNVGKERLNAESKKNSFSQDCALPTAQSDLDINNVRTRLLVGGDMWWNGNQGQYIVPQVAPGEPEVSSIFAGAVWMGGMDALGNLKVSAQQYGTASGDADFWPGPLLANGSTQTDVCENWDQIFSVTGEEIDLHLAQFQQAEEDNTPYDVSLMPKGVKEWPAIGNEFFFDSFGFELPETPQGLAPFWDENGDGIYTPQFGDYPILDIRGCDEPLYADGMKFWIFNDNGNVHTNSGADPMLMEIQAQAFAFATDDALNDMTFTRYKLISRASESIDSTFFAVWMDADLGCGEDDYVGCDTTRNLMYVYNKDAIDGSTGSDCKWDVPTYGDKIPYLGVDLFRGPLAPKVIGPNGELSNPGMGQPFDTIVELGMTSFIYFRPTQASDPVQIGPSTALEHFNYLNGRWRNGLPMTAGGSGFGGTEVTKFVFHDEPNDPDGWSMCTANLLDMDFRTVQSSGPFRLDPGQVNELIIGIPWVPDVEYPCPDMGRLFEADDLAQDMFDSCFEGFMTTATTSPEEPNSQLDKINVYPNPVPTSSNVSITNVPPQSTVTIYSIEGKFVTQIQTDRNGQAGQGSTIEWDMTSTSGASIANGTYFIHVQAEGVGERVLKLICIK